MALIVRKTGIIDTLQDLGRFGFMRYGVNSNGAMDRTAVRLLNILLCNDENEAVIECHFPAGEYAFVGPPAPSPSAVRTSRRNSMAKRYKTGSLSQRLLAMFSGFRKPRFGNRVYVAIKGGIRVNEWLGSKITNLAVSCGGFNGRKLEKGDLIETEDDSTFPVRSIGISASLLPFSSQFS